MTNNLKEKIQIEKALIALEKEKINAKALNNPAEGVGDTIQAILTKFGITDGLIKRVLGRDCNCGGRKNFLNKLFPYSKKD